MKKAERTIWEILLALSFCHWLNDTIQSLIPAIYPLLKASFHLSFTQVGLITLTFQLTASLLQPVVGIYADRRPHPHALPIGMTFTLVGLALLAFAPHYGVVLVSVALVGLGSSVFHPEASRVANLAAGRRPGMAQSLFQLGGNFGTSLGPLLAAAIVATGGQRHVLWFSLAALLAISVLIKVGSWCRHLPSVGEVIRSRRQQFGSPPPRRRVILALGILLLLIFSKYFYLVSLTNYYIFYLMGKYHLPVRAAQVDLFIFLFSVAAGTIIGGPVGDRFGRKLVIWVSILGVAPFTLLLPHAGLAGTIVLTVFIGVILASAFPAILVYAQDLIPGRVGLVAGLFFGLAFGMGGVGSVALGALADHTSINFVFEVCAYLPLMGLLTAFLPNTDPPKASPEAQESSELSRRLAAGE